MNSFDKILWLDLEMTGLVPETDVIIEAAACITTKDFKELESYTSVVKQDQSYLKKMDKWNQTCHRKSGLYPLIPKGKQLSVVEDDLLYLIEKFYKKEEEVILAGNCIYQDRSFIRRYMPRLEKRLYYRMLDITAWKLIFEDKNIVFEKKNSHRALDDVKESIQEFRYYLSHINFISPEKAD